MRRIAQAVDVVEAQALQPVLRDQARDQRMHGAEGRGVLDAQAGEIVDVEEAAVVHRREGDAPVGEAIVLAFEQAVQRARRRRRCRRDRPTRPRSITSARAVDAGQPLL